MARLFGTDGVRGVANTPALSVELAMQLGQTATALMAEDTHGRRPLAVIGLDTRRSGEMLAAALAAGICSAGGDVVRLGVVSTPAVAFLTRTLGADFGVMISASHNPAPDNGIKFFSRDGFKLPDEVEDRLEAIMREGDGPRPTGEGVGIMIDDPGAVDDYIRHIVKTCPVPSLRGLRVVVDCANGAAYELSPTILRRLGAEVIALNTSPDGLNINDNCGSTHMEALQRAVVAYKAHVGIAHDGDADRCLAVDEQGNLVDGDQLLAICGLALKRHGKLAANTVVCTVMSNLGLDMLLRQEDIKWHKTRVGDRYVLEEMLRNGACLGGEQSGHIIFLEHNTTGDGVLTAVQLLGVMQETGKPLSELAGQMERFPQMLENLHIERRQGWDTNPRIAHAISAAQSALGETGRVLVRASGTEPLIRVMLEGRDLEVLKRHAATLKEVIVSELG